MTLPIPITLTHPDAAPRYARPGDAGADLTAREAAYVPAGGRAVVGTGVAAALRDGYAGFVVPRSGLAAKHGITVLNAPGLIDSGYRGEIKVILLNTGSVGYRVTPGDRIAQLVVQRVEHVDFEIVTALDDTDRGTGGLGSTGMLTTFVDRLTTSPIAAGTAPPHLVTTCKACGHRMKDHHADGVCDWNWCGCREGKA